MTIVERRIQRRTVGRMGGASGMSEGMIEGNGELVERMAGRVIKMAGLTLQIAAIGAVPAGS